MERLNLPSRKFTYSCSCMEDELSMGEERSPETMGRPQELPRSGLGSWNMVAPMALERRMELKDGQAAKGTGMGDCCTWARGKVG